MPERICSIDGCEKPVRARGWCAKHWDRWYIHGDPHHTRQTALQRFNANYVIDPSSGCWLWTAALHQKTRYGQFSAEGRRVLPHRFSYETFVGPIPEGLVIDHLCRVRHCVNPQHLEAVTQWENNYRGMGRSAVNARKTVCKYGHPFTPENTVFTKEWTRQCRTCRRLRSTRKRIA